MNNTTFFVRSGNQKKDDKAKIKTNLKNEQVLIILLFNKYNSFTLSLEYL